MLVKDSLGDFCRTALSKGFRSDPLQAGKLLCQYARFERTPTLKQTVELISALGIGIEAVEYLNGGGVNFAGNGLWHIHHAAKDRPATQKFTILHELFEIIQKNCAEVGGYQPLQEPQMSRLADRFAGAVLLPRQYFLKLLIETGCDLVKLGEGLELSHQSLLIAMEQHLENIPFVGALYDHQLNDGMRSRQKTNDYVMNLVVKTVENWSLNRVCRRQAEPVPTMPPKSGTLLCAALHSGQPVFYHCPDKEKSAAVLVRPIYSGGQAPYRVLLLALPEAKSNRFYPQVDNIQAVTVDEESPCPAAYKCRSSINCRWRNPTKA